jgi:hypothetical protein
MGREQEGSMNWLAIVVATIAFFAIGALWYGVLFGKAWQAETGVTDRPPGSGVAKVMLGTLLAEFVVVVLVGHMFDFLDPTPHGKMMLATGLGLAVMTPALVQVIDRQRRSLKLFLIDASHFIVGMAAVGGVFVLLD